MSSTRSRVVALGLALVALGGCHMPSGSGPGRKGTALIGSGPQLHGVLGFPHVRPGLRYRFSYPMLKNRGKETVEITRMRLLHVPEGVKVLGYSVYSDLETNGFLLSGRDPGSRKMGDPDFGSFHDYYKRSYSIKPGVLSDKYGSVLVEVTGRVRGHLGGCRVEYKQGDVSYYQDMHCEFALDSAK
ncbi:hypothetical protein [Streptomyces sp. NPDC005435]|uniref:hypothetical protein n=1 Tax=Streptomyces sp. NPDC005435 TaxID=3154464 RepID=UPI003455C384